jgi:hypothetical protein
MGVCRSLNGVGVGRTLPVPPLREFGTSGVSPRNGVAESRAVVSLSTAVARDMLREYVERARDCLVLGAWKAGYGSIMRTRWREAIEKPTEVLVTVSRRSQQTYLYSSISAPASHHS